MSGQTYFVRLESGVVVRMTREQYEAFWKGVDKEAANLLGSPSGCRPTALSKETA